VRKGTLIPGVKSLLALDPIQMGFHEPWTFEVLNGYLKHAKLFQFWHKFKKVFYL
jgi:hypothetical protein